MHPEGVELRVEGDLAPSSVERDHGPGFRAVVTNGGIRDAS